MKLDWMRDVSQEDKQDRMDMVRSAKPTLDLQKKILEKRVQELQAGMLSQQNYESPAWAEMQADKLGAIRELTYVISLLTLDRETK